VTLEGAARDYDDAMPVPTMQAWVANARCHHILTGRFVP
jgi:hypothetical protein